MKHRVDQLTYDTGIEPNEDYGVITISYESICEGISS